MMIEKEVPDGIGREVDVVCDFQKHHPLWKLNQVQKFPSIRTTEMEMHYPVGLQKLVSGRGNVRSIASTWKRKSILDCVIDARKSLGKLWLLFEVYAYSKTLCVFNILRDPLNLRVLKPRRHSMIC